MVILSRNRKELGVSSCIASLTITIACLAIAGCQVMSDRSSETVHPEDVLRSQDLTPSPIETRNLQVEAERTEIATVGEFVHRQTVERTETPTEKPPRPTWTPTKPRPTPIETIETVPIMSLQPLTYADGFVFRDDFQWAPPELAEEGELTISSLAVVRPEQFERTLIEQGRVYSLQDSTHGDVAVVLGYHFEEIWDPKSRTDIQLSILDINSLKLRDTQSLLRYHLPIVSSTEDSEGPLDPLHVAIYTIARNTPQWSPNGRYLAFVGAIESPSSDLYIYDRKNRVTHRLSDGPNHAFMPIWAPDSIGILHLERTYKPDQGFVDVALWWGKIYEEKLQKLDYAGEIGQITFQTWLTNDKSLWVSHDEDNQVSGPLFLADVGSGRVELILPNLASNFVSINTEDNVYVLVIIETPDALSELVLLEFTDGQLTNYTPSFPQPRFHDSHLWHENLIGIDAFDYFIANTTIGLVKINTDGSWEIIDSYNVERNLDLSPDKRWLAVQEYIGQSIGPVYTFEVKQDTLVRITPDMDASFMEWSPDSKSLLLNCFEDSFAMYIPEINRYYYSETEGHCPVWEGWSINMRVAVFPVLIVPLR